MTKNILAMWLVLFTSVCLPRTLASETDKDGIPAVVDGSNALAMNLYAKLAARDNGNVFFSPSSIDAWRWP